MARPLPSSIITQKKDLSNRGRKTEDRAAENGQNAWMKTGKHTSGEEEGARPESGKTHIRRRKKRTAGEQETHGRIWTFAGIAGIIEKESPKAEGCINGEETAMTQEKIARINALGKKSRAEGLTEEEKAEQTRLRREYLDAIKGSLRSQLDSITVVDANGKETKLKEKHTKHPSES